MMRDINFLSWGQGMAVSVNEKLWTRLRGADSTFKHKNALGDFNLLVGVINDCLKVL
jgi:hypothetical protein